MRIRRLNEEVCGQLKAHEYVLSFTSVVNELIQNSIDANSSHIDVTVNTNIFQIVASDDGDGIVPSDLDLVGGQNFTSKIKSLLDLRNIKTYGFRGEAFFMIFKCSQIDIITKPEGYSGVWKRRFPNLSELVNRNDVPEILKSGKGTVVKIDDLFFNFPVRRQMMKKKSTTQIVHSLRKCVLGILLIHPDIKLTLHVNNTMVINSKNISKCMDYPSKLALSFQNVFGNPVPFDELKFISSSFKSYQVKGLISLNPIQTKDYQHIFINSRRYDDAKFISSLDKLFQSTKYVERSWNSYTVKSVGSPYNSHPVLIIKCDSPLEVSDLLQDPRKNVLQSEHLKILHPLITNVVTSFLKHLGYEVSTPELPQPPAFLFDEIAHFNNDKSLVSPLPKTYSEKIETSKIMKRSIPKLSSILQQVPKDRSIISKIESQVKHCNRQDMIDSELDIKSLHLLGSESEYLKSHQLNEFKLVKSQIKEFEVIKQIDHKFILIKYRKMLLIMDQHACHERITVENMLRDFIQSVFNKSIISTEISLSFDISHEESIWFKQYENEFELWGVMFDICDVCNLISKLTVSRVPTFFQEKVKSDQAFLKNVLLQHVYDLKNNYRRQITQILVENSTSIKWWTVIPFIPRVYLEIINSKSCRSAVMFGTPLTDKECQIIVNDLSKCQWPFQCAHGRPSVVPISKLEDHFCRANTFDYEII